MGNNENKNLGITITIVLGILLISTIIYYEYYAIPEKIDKIDKICVKYMVGVNNLWLDFIENRSMNITPEEKYEFKELRVTLNEIAEKSDKTK